MAVVVAAPAVGLAAAAIGSGDGEEGGGEAASEVAGKEEARPPEGVLGTEVEGRKGAAALSEAVPAAISVEGGEGEVVAAAEVEEGVKWLKHYSSMHSILTVGDGDFSFSLSLASRLGSGRLIVATSLDTYEVLIRKYSDAKSNIMKLKRLETTVLHGVDVNTMRFYTDLKNRRFDRIVFNFPHAGFHGPEDHLRVINLHKKLLRGFFCNARQLLLPYAEIHVRHKIGWSYDKWDLEHLASEFSLIMSEKEVFHIADYPGYNQKRGAGARCDQPFPLGPCCTFKFQFRVSMKQRKLNENNAISTSSLGGSNVNPPGNLETDTRLLHLLPPVQAWPRLHFTSPVNTAHMLIGLPQPHIAAQRQQPAFPLNLDGIMRAAFRQQPMFSIPGSNAPGGIPPPMSRIASPSLLALLEQPWYQQRSIGGLLEGDDCSYFERQRCLQRQCEMQRKAGMPGATGLSYSSAFLEQCHRESVQRKEHLNWTIAWWLSGKDHRGDFGDLRRRSMQ